MNTPSQAPPVLSDEEYADLERTYRKAEDHLARQDLHHKEHSHVQRPQSPRPL